MLIAFLLSLTTAHSVSTEFKSFEAQRLIEMTKTTRASYAVVSRNTIWGNNALIYEFSAEFNDGDWHRVETPRDRVVANCRTGWNAHMNVATGTITRNDPTSGMACGVYTGDGVVNAEAIGRVDSPFGPLQQLTITTRVGATRAYGIAPNGAILSESIIDPSGKPRLILTAISFSDRASSADLFSEASLAKSAVSENLIEQASKPLK